MTDPSAPRMMSTTDGHPDTLTNVFPKPKDEFPGAAEFNKIMANSDNMVRLQKLVKEHIKTVVSRFRGSIIYCEGETSTNLSTDVATTDFGFKHLEADTMLLSAYTKLMAENNKEVVL